MINFVKSEEKVLSPNHNDHLDLVEKGGYVYFADQTTIDFIVAENCNLAIMKEKFAPLLYGVGTQNNSVFKDLFSEK